MTYWKRQKYEVRKQNRGRQGQEGERGLFWGVFSFQLLAATCGISVTQPGIEPTVSALEVRVLTTRPSGEIRVDHKRTCRGFFG